MGNYFSGYFNPVPFKYMWSKMRGKAGMPGLGAVYQSELLDAQAYGQFSARGAVDVELNEFLSSPDFFKQLREAMGNDNNNSNQLSMRFNIDMYVTDSGQSNFTTGRISGTARRKSAKNDFVSGFLLPCLTIKHFLTVHCKTPVTGI